jgi:hypothetical protein
VSLNSLWSSLPCNSELLILSSSLYYVVTHVICITSISAIPFCYYFWKTWLNWNT